MGLPQASAQEKKCATIKAADGSCANGSLVDMGNSRGTIVASLFSSYIGPPQGTIGPPYISPQSLFRNDQLVSGLPTGTITKVHPHFKPVWIYNWWHHRWFIVWVYKGSTTTIVKTK
jgi:hypothetical protein